MTTHQALIPAEAATTLRRQRQPPNGESGPILRRPDSGPTDRDLFEDLFARRVSDVASGAVCIVAADRQPGIGTAVTVRSTVAGLDAAAACTGGNRQRLRDIEAWFPGEHITVTAQADSASHV